MVTPHQRTNGTEPGAGRIVVDLLPDALVDLFCLALFHNFALFVLRVSVSYYVSIDTVVQDVSMIFSQKNDAEDESRPAERYGRISGCICGKGGPAKEKGGPLIPGRLWHRVRKET